MAEQKLTPEAFRDSLKDLVELSGKLAPFATTVQELIEIIELALLNDAQLRLLLAILTQKR